MRILHSKYVLVLLFNFILTARCCSADACHLFQDMHHPGIINSNTLDYCQRNLSLGCCTMTSVLNYEQFISRYGIGIPGSNIKTGSKCQQMSHELACHYGCSPYISIDFDAKTYYFHPQFNFDFILKFVTECRNSMWCGTWDSFNSTRPANTGCYAVQRGRIVYRKNKHISNTLLSATQFAKQVLDARFAIYSGTRDPSPIIIKVEHPIKHGILFEIMSIVAVSCILAFC